MALHVEDTPIVTEEENARNREAAEAEIRSRLRKRDWKKVQKHLAMARLIMEYREHPKYGLISLLQSYRVILLKLGEKLAARGVLEKKDDIFFLTAEDLLYWEDGKVSGEDFKEKVRAAREVWQSGFAMEPARLIFTPECDVVTISQASRQAISQLPPNVLKGLPTSAGCVEGRAVVGESPHTTVIRKGEILVAKSTDPGWTPLFAPAAGVAIEIGGRLTHGSVVAKEMGIPCVVCVHGLVEKVKTGMRIRVDGTKGIVEILDENCNCMESFVCCE